MPFLPPNQQRQSTEGTKLFLSQKQYQHYTAIECSEHFSDFSQIIRNSEVVGYSAWYLVAAGDEKTGEWQRLTLLLVDCHGNLVERGALQRNTQQPVSCTCHDIKHPPWLRRTATKIKCTATLEGHRTEGLD